MNTKKKVTIAAVVTAAAAAAIYAGAAVHYNSCFLPHTQIAGIEASGMTPEEVTEQLKNETAEYSLTLNGTNTTDTITAYDISLTLDADSALKQTQDILDQQNSLTWLSAEFSDDTEYDISKSYSWNENQLDSILTSSEAVTNTDITKSQKASYEYDDSEGKFVVTDEVYGNEVDIESLKANVEDALTSGDESIDLSEDGSYVQPSRKADDESLTNLVDELNKRLDVDITYEVGEKGTFTVDKATQSSWLTATKKLKFKYDTDAMLDFARSMGSKYNSFGLSRQLKTVYGSEVTVKGGNYGWWINYNGEVEQLKQDMESGQDVTRDFVYYYEAANHGDWQYDYGDSYVEINLAEQHLFVIVDGKQVFDSDFVSGMDVKGRRTPLGAYRVNYKEHDATLVGENYSSDVEYWMPFNGNVGMHDAPWRSAFGGDIYKTSGSHGCINLPVESAKKIFSIVDKGFPVLVYRKNVSDEQEAKAIAKTES